MEIKRLFVRLRNKVLARAWLLSFSDFWHRRTIRRVMNLSPAQKRALGIERTVRLVGNFMGLWQRTIEGTPGGSCIWGKTLFVAEGEADHYVILNSLTHPIDSISVPQVTLPGPERVWGLHMEPEEYVKAFGYDRPEEHAMVSRFYTNCKYLLDRGGIYRPAPPYVHLHLGKDWNYLNQAPEPRKPITLGIICSALDKLPGHQERIRFLERLDASDIEYVLWGRGTAMERFRGYRGFVKSKWGVHAPCRYSIVIENSVAPFYWTEKIADSIVCYSFPLYHGCPNLDEFLPAESFEPFDISRPDALDVLRAILKRDPYESRRKAIAEARHVLLHTENLYAFLDRELEALKSE
ncbi:MAG: hypothetical protein JWL59_4033 [Chthoniobacteraceae bacterium]|nr:hypothetical protein [Chthoniobacteraceae bacterium]